MIRLITTVFPRCVRQAYLCGEDKQTGKSYEHRRQWVEDYLLTLAEVFAIDVCAYAVMSNHTHIVLHVNQQQAEAWSRQEVLERWHRLHKGTLLTQMYLNKELHAQLGRKSPFRVSRIIGPEVQYTSSISKPSRFTNNAKSSTL